MSTPILAPPSGEVAVLRNLCRRPGLLLGEILWRWTCGGFLILIAAYEATRIWAASLPSLRPTGILEVSADNLLENPLRLLPMIGDAAVVLRPMVERAALGLIPLMVFCWVLAFVVGRMVILARYDARLLRRPSLLATCEGLRLCLMLTVPVVWIVLLQLASNLALRGEAPYLLLYGAFFVAITFALWTLWTRLTRTINLSMAIGLLEPISFSKAYAQAWRLYRGAIPPQALPLRRASRQAQFALFIILVICTVLPAPFSKGWLLFGWWIVLSLLPMAAQDIARLGILFALLGVVRTVRAASPGTSPV